MPSDNFSTHLCKRNIAFLFLKIFQKRLGVGYLLSSFISSECWDSWNAILHKINGKWIQNLGHLVLYEFLSTVYSEMLSQITFQSLCIASVIVNCIIFTSQTIMDVLVATVFSI